MERKPNPFDSNLSIPAIQILSELDGGGGKIGEAEKQEILNYLASHQFNTENLVDFIFELVNEGFLVLNCW